MKDINKDIEILENLLEEGFEAMCYPEAQAIEHLIKAYKELEYKYNKALSDLVQAEHKNKELEEENVQLEAIKDEAIRRYNFESIPVSLVEEKIEELKKKQEEMTIKNHNADNINDCYLYGDEAEKAMYQKEILQELLEKSE